MVETWAEEWTLLLKESTNLESSCREDLERWKSADVGASILERRCSIPELLESNLEDFDTWHSDLWRDLRHVRKRICALGMNLTGRHTTHHQLNVVANDIESELGVFKDFYSRDFSAAFSDGIELDRRLNAMSLKFDDMERTPKVRAMSLKVDNGEDGTPSNTPAPNDSPNGDGNTVTSPSAQQEDPEISDIRRELAEIQNEIELARGVSTWWSSVHEQAVVRTFRLFKMHLSPAFFQRLRAQLPDESEDTLVTIAEYVAAQENRNARKRCLLARWRRRCEEILSKQQRVHKSVEFVNKEMQLNFESDHVAGSKTEVSEDPQRPAAGKHRRAKAGWEVKQDASRYRQQNCERRWSFERSGGQRSDESTGLLPVQRRAQRGCERLGSFRARTKLQSQHSVSCSHLNGIC